jgi:hypothetical protein
MQKHFEGIQIASDTRKNLDRLFKKEKGESKLTKSEFINMLLAHWELKNELQRTDK